MLRSRSVSPRSIGRSVSSLVVFASLLLAAPAFAESSVFVEGPAGSARVAAIVAELQSRGIDATTAADRPAVELSATVHVADDGTVDVRAGDHRETFSAADTDAVLARRVAETLRTVEPAAPPPAPPPAITPPAPPPPPPSSRTKPEVAPARAFTRAGTVLLSVDNALPLVTMGASNPLSQGQVLRIGDPTYGAAAALKVPSLDVAVTDHVTLGATLIFEAADRGSTLGGSVRFGYFLPLGDRLALWPRLGVSTQASLGRDTELLSRSDLEIEARLVWTPTPSWALTFGPSLGLPFQKEFRGISPDTLVEIAAARPDAIVVVAQKAPPRLGVSIGITGKLRETSDLAVAPSGGTPSVLFGVERAAPLLRLSVGTTHDTGARPRTVGEGGTADPNSIVPQSPRVAVDVRVGENVTLGAAGSVGWVRSSSFSSSTFAPSDGAETLAWSLSPRAGYYLPLARAFALWPRVGLTYANAASTQTRTNDALGLHHLGADLDGFAVFSPVEGVGLLIGPSIEVPILGARRNINGPYDPSSRTHPTQHHDEALLTLGLTAGVVLTLP